MTETNTGRDLVGRYAAGNPGGPGRPRRAVEMSYLRALSDALPVDTWSEIVQAAIARAKDGDAQARAWLTRLILGAAAPTLSDLAKVETLNLEPDDVIESEAQLDQAAAHRPADDFDQLLSGRISRPAPLIGAIQRRDRDIAARQAERDRAERAERKARRESAAGTQ